MGSHRYPSSWLEDRFAWVVDGVPSVPDWTILQAADKEKVDEKVVSSADEERDYQQFLVQKLGKISFAQEDDKFVVDHEIQVCGNTVKIPVMSLEIDGQQDLIDEQYLKILQMTLAERRANMQTSNAVQQKLKMKAVKKKMRLGGSAVA